jgi:hypothetical protein
MCCFRHAPSSVCLSNVSPLQLPRLAVHKDNVMLYSPTQTTADNSRCTVTIQWSQRVQVLVRFERKSGEAADLSSICSSRKLLSFWKNISSAAETNVIYLHVGIEIRYWLGCTLCANTGILLWDKDGTHKELYKKGKRYINNVERPNVISNNKIY